MPDYTTEVLNSYSNEYIIQNDGGLYSIHRVYDSPGCVAVYGTGNKIVGCFSCSGAQENCNNYCGGVEIIELQVNERVRLSNETLNSDEVDFCAAPNTSLEYGGFCLSSEYPRDGVYSAGANSKNPTPHQRGNLRLYFNDSYNAGQCIETLENANGQYCESGFYLTGGKCITCPSGAATGVPNYHSLGQDAACKSIVIGDEDCDDACTSSQYDLSMYFNLDCTKCVTCPSGAKCNGENIFCPVGSYVYYPYDDKTYPSCVKCPDGGMVDTFFTNSLENCTNPTLDLWGKGQTSDCTWTDYTYDDATSCRQYRGSDKTGTYEFRNPTSGDWEYCDYRL